MKAGGGELTQKDLVRFNGTSFYYYRFISGKLGLNEDPFFFDDNTEMLFESSINKYDHLKSLKGRRLNLAFLYSMAILLNYYLSIEQPVGMYLYLMSKAALGLGITIGFLIRWVYFPYVKYVAYPIAAFIEFLIALGSLMITTLIDIIEGR